MTKSRKRRKGKVPNPRSTSPLGLRFNMQVDNTIQEKDSNEEIREIQSPYLSLVPDYLANRCAIPLQYMVVKKRVRLYIFNEASIQSMVENRYKDEESVSEVG